MKKEHEDTLLNIKKAQRLQDRKDEANELIEYYKTNDEYLKFVDTRLIEPWHELYWALKFIDVNLPEAEICEIMDVPFERAHHRQCKLPSGKQTGGTQLEKMKDYTELTRRLMRERNAQNIQAQTYNSEEYDEFDRDPRPILDGKFFDDDEKWTDRAKALELKMKYDEKEQNAKQQNELEKWWDNEIIPSLREPRGDAAEAVFKKFTETFKRLYEFDMATLETFFIKFPMVKYDIMEFEKAIEEEDKKTPA